MSNSKRAIDLMLKLHRQWMSETSEEIKDYALQQINSGLAQGSIRALRNVCSNLRSLGVYWGISGELALVDGNPCGWQQVNQSCAYYFWALKCELLLFRKLGDSPSLTLFAPLTACMLCFTMSSGLDTWRHDLSSLLVEMASDECMVKRAYWHSRQFEPFVLRLLMIKDHGSAIADNESDGVGVYNDVLAHWGNGGSNFAQALRQICDYHCMNMDDVGDKDPEFDHPPFDLIPWEMHAIGRIRHDAGLDMPMISHPLMSLVAKSREHVVLIEDDTLARVQAVYVESWAS